MVLFVFFYLGFVLYLFVGWNYLKYQPLKRTATINPLATVVLPIRNESENIKRVLADLQNQENLNFQLLIVDDFSTDNTVSVVKSFLLQSTMQAELIELKDILSENKSLSNNKKSAISEGVKRATGELIICIDGDVQLNTGWFQSMYAYFNTYDVVFFSANVLYTHQNSFLGRFLEVDQINNMAVTIATYQWKNPTMANGANMAFSKSAWNEVNGYQGIMQHASGDDMMLLHRMTKTFPDKIGFNIDEKATTYTSPVSSLNGFIHQRVRWFGKVFNYEGKSSIWFLMLGLLLNGFVVYHLCTFPFHPMKSSLVLLVKMLLDTLFLTPPLYNYKREKYFVFLPIFSLIFSLYIISIALITPFVKYKWKRS